MQHPKGGYVFIVTYGRSGSTVLQTLLQSIDGYCIKGENNNILLPLFDAFRQSYEAKFKHGRREQEPERPWYGAYHINPARFAEKLTKLFVEEIIQPPEDARVVGFKEIRFHQVGPENFENFLNFIAEYFPGTKFIFNSRHWEDVSRSSWWATMDPARVRAIVEGADTLYKAYAEKYPKRCYQLQYEDYKGNPSAFQGLFDFLGETYDEKKVAAILGHELDHCK